MRAYRRLSVRLSKRDRKQLRQLLRKGIQPALPHQLGPLALQNPRIVYGILFRAVGETLLEVGEKRLAARCGFLAVLHTWGQTLGTCQSRATTAQKHSNHYRAAARLASTGCIENARASVSEPPPEKPCPRALPIQLSSLSTSITPGGQMARPAA